MSKKHNLIVIGSGFAGLSAATSLAQLGFDVTLIEKHKVPGGRARKFSEAGFTFDMGPSWYWMPDVFEEYFGRFNKKPSYYYELIRLDPSYSVFFGHDEVMHVPADYAELLKMFEKYEKGSGQNLDRFLNQAAYKYEVGMNKLVKKPSRSLTEFASLRLLYDVLRMDVFKSFSSHARKFFSDSKLLQLVEFPVLFLGATPQNTPALYSLMNYADMKLGTWYPAGGMHKIVEGMVALAEEMGVKFKLGQEVKSFIFNENKITGVETDQETLSCDGVISGADYHHTETNLLPGSLRNYSDNYWQKRTMAPSSLIYYLGVNKRVKNLLHHNLFFDQDFGKHAREIYDQPQWPENPLFYVSAPGKTDPTVAPDGMENMFILIPVAPGLNDTPEIREKYYHMVMSRLEALTGERIKEYVVVKKTYAHRDFINDYHAFKGNAYGLANTLKQTAILKPSFKNKKVANLYYTGQLTVPGPGVPPSLISGQLVAGEVAKESRHW
ncbi:phytoene desaturase family protein [Roseivirga sp. BDSF3-8]|uniref:phytoene desaturase family protein n=1 Tax=Roseivirga sp. BDSF3-8 TaxID=3241598 RepID=UPI003532308C